MQILVMTKKAGKELQSDMTRLGKKAHLFHSGLNANEKDQVHSLMGKDIVIATTGISDEPFDVDIFFYQCMDAK
jgi:hypothetical protein